jgi:hypothetical protein
VHEIADILVGIRVEKELCADISSVGRASVTLNSLFDLPLVGDLVWSLISLCFAFVVNAIIVSATYYFNYKGDFKHIHQPRL